MAILDVNRKGWIDGKDIEKFIRGQGIPIHIQDINQLIQLYENGNGNGGSDGKIFIDSIQRII